MNSLNIISSVAVAFILLRASFCAAREERTSKTARREANIYPYLVLVECGTPTKVQCAGSIVSPSKVLSLCTCDETATKVYAGLNSAAETNGENVQQRTVTLVAKHPSNESIKIFSVDEWNLTENVKTVKLHFNKEGEKPTGTCKLVGFKDGAAAQELDQAIGDCGTCEIEDTDVFCTTAAADKLLKAVDLGGPTMCNNDQWGINAEGVKKSSGRGTDFFCNKVLNITHHRDWIDEAMAEKPDGPGGPGGSGNSTASSGYSIHSYLNKYSNWKVLGFLAPTIVTFLQY